MEREQLHIQQCLQGNTSAFVHLVQLHKDKVYGLALRIVRSPQDAEEVAQDVFVKAFENLHKFKGGAQLSTWLFRITNNTAISFMRKRRLATVELNEQVTSRKPCSQKEATEKELRLTKLELSLALLSEEERSMVTLHYLNRYGISGIAEITGLSKSNVKVRLHRARKKLLTLMAEV